ncbi:methylase [Ostreococcus tauri]|uniref:2-phytyl-1,4-beta-naphthoquinone methyltransferase, chloroplastic n=1 Tax=Ostreococcus tauri TaxID=70448 RepID=A0A1Y5IC80_OSTTA|nr:methylase [Ostreococcus tauri]
MHARCASSLSRTSAHERALGGREARVDSARTNARGVKSSKNRSRARVTAIEDPSRVAGNPFEQNADAADERRELFNDIAPVYDRLNDALSLGLHRAWKRAAVKWIECGSGMRALDVCCGSGDVAIKMSTFVGSEGSVTGLDFAAKQLTFAAEKEREERSRRGTDAMGKIDWIEGDALNLPFEDDSFDCATIAYGLRNVSDIPRAMRELRRVVRPGAKVAVLDFNNPDDPTTAAVQGFMLDNVVVPIADLNGVAAEYRYLRPSIERFPRGQEQVDLARDAGFREATFYELQPGGLMGCLVCTK